MKKRYKLRKRSKIIIFLIFISFSLMLLLSEINSLLSDNILSKANMTTGTLSVELDNLKIYKDSSNFVTPDENHDTGIRIEPDEIAKFSFDVKNTGSSGISTDIYLSINFNKDLKEEGVILVYPAIVSDANIINELKSGIDTSAIIKLNVNDQTSINSSVGTFNGIREKIETRLLDSTTGMTGIATTAGETEHHYEYKIVFFDGVSVVPDYYFKTIEVKIEVDAKLHNLDNSGWIASDSDYFKITTGPKIKFVRDGLILLYDGVNNSGEGHDGSSAIWRDLVGTNDGTLMDNPKWENSSLKFDGIDDRVLFKGDIPATYTVISTFYFDKTVQNSTFPRIYSENPFPSLYIDNVAAQRVLGIFGHGVDVRFPNSRFEGFIQTAMTYNGTHISLYINGEFISSIASTVAPTSIEKAYLGGREVLDRQFKGNMYNFMIYDRPLTQSEIDKNYHATLNETVIPITTLEQLMKIGSGEIIEIDDELYEFANNSQYEIKNDLTVEYNGEWEPNISRASGGRITSYDKVITIKNTSDNTIRYYQNQVFVTKDNAVESGLVLHYDSVNNTGTGYDNTATIWKDLQGNNNATLQGGVIWDNNRLSFDGINGKATFKGDITNNYSMVITIKPELVGAHPRLFAENPFPTLYLHSGNQYRFGFYGQGRDQVFSPTITPVTDKPTYVVVTYNGTNINLYVNGEYTGRMATATLPTATATAYLGANAGTTRQYTGDIYDFMIYDRVLTDFEIERSYITNSYKYTD